MAGGIFKDQPFALNPKCIVISLIFAIFYWYMPYRKWYILVFILWVTYIAIAWYDDYYKCKYKMHPTIFPFGKYIYLPFKPKSYQNEYKRFPKWKIAIMDKVNHISLWTLLMVLVGGLGIWWFYPRTNKKIADDKNATNTANTSTTTNTTTPTKI
jgi:UDP-N-acetylmuramyl pentapeptide phosphotransferase/UDP-N-acetylglucosamine-1-phosphate transferase